MDLPDILTRDSSPQAKICIIGGGPAGLNALKVIMDTPQYKSGSWIPTVFEQRETAGGVWIPAPTTDDPPFSPLYDSLTTNLPHLIMSFTDFPFPPSTPVFPKACKVAEYLHSYIEHFHLAKHIQLETKVLSVTRPSERWSVCISTGETMHFDLVLVCNGHYRKPRIPSIPGLERWLTAQKAMHSVFYRRPDPSYGSTLLVIGGGPSGNDISSDLCAVCHTVIQSTRSPPVSEDAGNLKHRGKVVRFGEDHSVHFEDGSTESSVDFCILATGYEMDLPFLSQDIIRSETPPSIPPLPSHLFNSTYHIFPLARHVLPMQNDYPSSQLAFIGLPSMLAPFPAFEAQVKAVLRVFSNPAALNYTEEAVDVMTRYERLRSEYNDDPTRIGNVWHKFEPHEQFQYRDTLCRFAEVEIPFEKTRVHDWEIEFYDNKSVLRKVWVGLEKAGRSAEFVEGVGDNGIQEWIDLLRKLVKMGDEFGVTLNEIDQSKL